LLSTYVSDLPLALVIGDMEYKVLYFLEHQTEPRACLVFPFFFHWGQRNDIVTAGGGGENRIREYDVARPIGKGKFAVVYRWERRRHDKAEGMMHPRKTHLVRWDCFLRLAFHLWKPLKNLDTPGATIWESTSSMLNQNNVVELSIVRVLSTIIVLFLRWWCAFVSSRLSCRYILLPPPPTKRTWGGGKTAKMTG